MASNIRVTELDFEQIKDNLRNFLRSQSQFTDYDFDASNLSVLVDLLAYNTHYNAVLANMVANEMFLDTAIKRSSVVSLAKLLNYTPRSARSARSSVNIALQGVSGSPNFVTLERYTPFTTNIDGTAYTFYNVDSYTTTPVSGVYTFQGVELYQGRKLDYFYSVTTPGPAEKYVIPNDSLDTLTLAVSVQYGGTGSFSDTFVRSDNVMNVTATSQVYYLQQNTQGLYEIYFGDDVLGQKLSAGDVVKVSYLISDGENANVSNNINVTWSTNSIAGESSGGRSITTVSNPSGGAAAEDIESIRFRSINTYAAQNRAVTKNDYASIISTNLPGAKSVNVWGGELNDPPQYGKIFISVAPNTGYVLTDAEKTRVIDEILRPRSMVTAQHEFVDPVYTDLQFRIHVRYNTTRTNRSSGQISQLINDKITEFIDNNLEQFNAPFYRSQLEEQLMDVDDAIVSVNVLFDLVKSIAVPVGVRFTGGQLKVPSKIHPNEVRTSYFYFDVDGTVYTGQVRDVPDESPPDYEGTGTLKTYDINTGELVEDNVGTVDYGTGLLQFNSTAQLSLSGYIGTTQAVYFYFGVQESVGDIFPDFNEILRQDSNTAEGISGRRAGIVIDIEAVNS